MQYEFNSHEFENTLKNFLECQLSPKSGCPENLKNAIEYSVLHPGKRLRPKIIYASSSLFSLQKEIVDLLAISIELIHCFSLIHDDLPCMDNDDLRRGKPTNHKVFGEATALLAGDALMPLASEALIQTKTYSSAEFALDAFIQLNKAMGASGMIGGQAQELCLGLNPSQKELSEIHLKKTGALFIACFLLPVSYVKNKNPELYKLLSDCGTQFGLCFQALDDLDDLTQDQIQKQKNLSIFEDQKNFIKSNLDKFKDTTNSLSSVFSPTSNNLVHLCNDLSFLIESKLNEL